MEASTQFNAKLQESLFFPSKLLYLVKFCTFFAWNHMFISVQINFLLSPADQAGSPWLALPITQHFAAMI